jgi:hypothetical protein
MAVTYAMSIKTRRMQAVVDDIGNGAVLEIGNAGFAAVLAAIPLASPCGTVTDDVLTFTMPETDTDADATGTAAAARIKSAIGIVKVSGLTVGVDGSGAAIIMNSVAIQQHAAVGITSAAFRHAT